MRILIAALITSVLLSVAFFPLIIFNLYEFYVIPGGFWREGDFESIMFRVVLGFLVFSVASWFFAVKVGRASRKRP